MQDVSSPTPLANRARQMLVQQPELPLPGSGRTLQRWQALAAWGAEDLCLAKVLEAHHDAQAILAELKAPSAAEGKLLAVWAAEGPANTLRIDSEGRLRGDKPWCSGSAWVDAALVTVRNAQGVWLCQVSAGQWNTLEGEPWPAVGMAGIPSTTVRFDGAQMALVGTRDDYLQRPGFWHGGAGIAAVWLGAAVSLAERMRPACSRGHRARLLGEVDLVLGPATALLRELAARIDAAPGSAHREDVVRVRCVVERAATRVLDLAGRALGPAPMCLEQAHARRWADLTVFMRQSHADRDWEWLGEQRATEEATWAL